jgi:MoaA/NifB/PqqE/SkfB family radical SAM enzyme
MCLVTFNFEEARTDAELKVRRFLSVGRPTWALVEVTERCDFGCGYCYASAGRRGREMDMALFKRLLDRLEGAGIWQVTLSGGEPLLHPGIVEIVREASDRGMVVHVCTNGYHLDRRMAGRLAGAGLSQVMVNLDSVHAARHDGMRGREGSFLKAKEALGNAVRAGILAKSQTVVTRENVGELEEIMALARSLGVRRVSYGELVQAGRSREGFSGDYGRVLEDLAREAKWLGAASAESFDPHFQASRHLKVYGVPCPSGCGMILNIGAGGEVYYCVTHRRILYNALHGDINRHVQELKRYLKPRGFPATKCLARGVDPDG